MSDKLHAPAILRLANSLSTNRIQD